MRRIDGACARFVRARAGRAATDERCVNHPRRGDGRTTAGVSQGGDGCRETSLGARVRAPAVLLRNERRFGRKHRRLPYPAHRRRCAATHRRIRRPQLRRALPHRRQRRDHADRQHAAVLRAGHAEPAGDLHLDRFPVSGTGATGANLNDNNYNMAYVNTVGGTGIFNSSTANFTRASGTSVLWAGLYWSGETVAGTSGARRRTRRSRTRCASRRRRPAVSRRSPRASSTRPPASAAHGSGFNGFADVTTLVQAGGSGTYAVANLQAATGQNRYGGWALIVVYRDTTLPLRDLTVFDGYHRGQHDDGQQHDQRIPHAGGRRIQHGGRCRRVRWRSRLDRRCDAAQRRRDQRCGESGQQFLQQHRVASSARTCPHAIRISSTRSASTRT